MPVSKYAQAKATVIGIVKNINVQIILCFTAFLKTLSSNNSKKFSKPI